jgi:hypothetical protein
MNIIFKFPMISEEINVLVDPNDTIEDVKWRIGEVREIEHRNMRIFRDASSGKQLADYKTVNELGVREMEVLYVYLSWMTRK